jgi:hypothetical protein
LSAIVARLMAVTEETDLVRFLRTGQDLRDYMQKVVADETDNTKSESSGNG